MKGRKVRCGLCDRLVPSYRAYYYPSAKTWLCRVHTVDRAEVEPTGRSARAYVMASRSLRGQLLCAHALSLSYVPGLVVDNATISQPLTAQRYRAVRIATDQLPITVGLTSYRSERATR